MRDERDSDSVRSSLHRSLQEAGPYLTLGLELGFTMIAWSAIGYFLDRWLDTLPWLTMAGVIVGMVSVFIQITRASRRLKNADKKNAQKRSRRRDQENGREE